MPTRLLSIVLWALAATVCVGSAPEETPGITSTESLKDISEMVTAGRHVEASALATETLHKIISGQIHKITDELHDVIATILDMGVVDVTSNRNGMSLSNGDTLLHSAVRRGDTTLVRMLLMAGANPAARSHDGLMTPLHLAVDYGFYEICHYLLKATQQKPRSQGVANAALVQDREGRTPLHMAVLRSPPSILRMLLAAEPRCLDIEDHHGDTPLSLAMQLPSSRPTLEELWKVAGASMVADRLKKSNSHMNGGAKVYNLEGESRGKRYRSGRDRLLNNGNYRRSGRAKRKSKLRCDIDILDAHDFASEDEMMHLLRDKYYARSRPVVIRNGVKDWPARNMLSRRRIISEFGDLVASTSAVPYVDGRKKTIREYMTKCFRPSKSQSSSRASSLSRLDKNGCAENEILFDRIYDEKFLQTIKLPKLARMCLSAYSRPAGLRWPQLIVSGPQSGAPFHEHQHAINGLIFGSKEWMLVPPGFGYLLAQSNFTNTATAIRQESGWNKAKEFLDSMGVLASCVQLSGGKRNNFFMHNFC